MNTRTEPMIDGDRTSLVGVVDVVIPCFNDGAFLLEAIGSLGKDRVNGAGIIIVNDGSDEGATLDVLAGLRMRGFQVIDQVNSGLSSARNMGWQACTAPYILFLDADNKVEPEYMERATALLDADSALSVVYSDMIEFGAREGIVKRSDINLPMLLVGNRVDACAVVRRSAIQAVGGYDQAMRDGYEDWELWIRMLSQGHRFAHIAQPLFHYRVREGSLVARADEPQKRGRIVEHVARKHAALFMEHAREVVAELHRIQAHDKALLQNADRIAAEAERTAGEALRAARHAGDELIALREELKMERDRSTQARAEQQQQHGRSEAALAELQHEKDTLATEAHRLVGEVDAAMRALKIHRDHGQALQALLGQYEERIKAIEGSRLWRMRRAYYKMRALLRTGSDTGRTGFKWLRRIAFLISSKGRVILRKFFAKIFKALYLWTEIRPVRIVVGEEVQQLQQGVPQDPYAQWMAKHFPRASDLRSFRDDVEFFGYSPLVSVVMPVYNTPVHFLDAAIRSVVEQVYPNWELRIADDKSTNADTRECLKRWMKEDARIHVVFRAENGHISKATNSALDEAKGEFVALMDHDDEIARDALYHVVKLLNRQRDLDIIYTDEDKIDEHGRHSDPHFKPQWSPDHLLSRNYFGHLVVYRASVLKGIGGCRDGFEGSQDYDALLRATERTQRIARIPRVLYHWRIHEASLARSEEVKPYAYDAAKRALTEALERRGEPAEVSFLFGFRGYDIRYKAPLKGKVSVIIPTKDKADVLGVCLRSLFSVTEHPDYEVIVVSNNSKERSLFDLMDEMKKAHGERFSWFAHDIDFNFSALMNECARRATGEHILYLNNDTEILHADWMRSMHEQCQRASIGAVGAKLLYHNDTIQHAGVVIGLGGVAGHAFTHIHKDGPGYFNYINTINNYSAVTAACMMVERKKLDAIGGWEERFSVEYNDVDLCLRLREHGWNNIYLPHVSLYHYESLTRGHPHMTKESYERHLREVGLFQQRWKKYVDDDPSYNPNLNRGVHDWSFAL